MSELKLAGCPFCGGGATIQYDSGNEVWGQSWACGCEKCGVMFKKMGSSSWNIDKKEDAAARQKSIDTWNRRATQPASAPADVLAAAQRRIAELEEALDIAIDLQNGAQSDAERAEKALDAVGAPQGQAEPVAEVVARALDIALDLAMAEAEHVHEAYKGYKPHKHAAVDADVQTIKAAIDAISPPTQPTQPAEREDP